MKLVPIILAGWLAILAGFQYWRAEQYKQLAHGFKDTCKRTQTAAADAQGIAAEWRTTAERWERLYWLHATNAATAPAPHAGPTFEDGCRFYGIARGFFPGEMDIPTLHRHASNLWWIIAGPKTNAAGAGIATVEYLRAHPAGRERDLNNLLPDEEVMWAIGVACGHMATKQNPGAPLDEMLNAAIRLRTVIGTNSTPTK